MVEALVIGVVLVAALACPVMMWLGRRGIGPGCVMSKCESASEEETIDDLRRRERELSEEIARFETAETEPGRVATIAGTDAGLASSEASAPRARREVEAP